MARLLIIDDDVVLTQVLAIAFADYEVTVAHDGREGLALAAAADLIISDVNMPHLDGFSLCRKLREAGNHVPLILLTSRDTDIDEALGLELGADDYLSKPFSTRVLQARVAALVRRTQARHEPATSSVRHGATELDEQRLEVRHGGVVVTTTVTEFRLLEVLMQRPGHVYSRTRLLDLLRGEEVVVSERIIDTYVRRLRRKLEAVDPEFASIETIIGAGYRWRDERSG